MKKVILSTVLCGMFLITNSALATSIITTNTYSNNLINNGSFDNYFTDWTIYNTSYYDNIYYDSYGYYASLGYYNESESISQVVKIPNNVGSAKLSFDYYFYTDDWLDTDYLYISAIDNATGQYVLSDVRYASDGSSSEWTKASYDLKSLAGKTITLYIGVTNDSVYLTYANIDDVKLKIKSLSALNIKLKNGKNAKYRVSTSSGKLLKKGKANSKGRFKVNNLKTYKNKLKIKITKNGLSRTYRLKIGKYGKTYQKTYTL